jgi:hypothetical protein
MSPLLLRKLRNWCKVVTRDETKGSKVKVAEVITLVQQKYEREGFIRVLVSSIFFIASTPVRRHRRHIVKKELAEKVSLDERFTYIYEQNLWGSRESVSGRGSTLEFTQAIRSQLPILLKAFSIKSIFDAPCGDFHWMSRVNLGGISYLGGDIVEPLIDNLKINYSTDSIAFVKIDITKEQFPKSDLVLNRDCLFHLSYRDILSILRNFIESNSKYFLSTSHNNQTNFLNTDIRSGDFRTIDLFIEPFNFPKEHLFEIAELGDGIIPTRKLYLWNRDQVKIAYESLSQAITGDAQQFIENH